VDVILEKDPAARSRLEVILCYPGFHAVAIHALAHRLYQSKHFLLARIISHLGRMLTGIEIHPGARLGRRLFIDHGMGVVIGETAIVGDDAVIYQGATLGAGAEARMGSKTRGVKRHPTLGNGVVVGSGAEIQGDISIGDNSRLASRSVVLKDVPPNSVVVGVPGRIIQPGGQRAPSEFTDLEAEAIKGLQSKVVRMEKEIESMITKPSRSETPPARDAGDGKIQEEPDAIEIFLQGAGI